MQITDVRLLRGKGSLAAAVTPGRWGARSSVIRRRGDSRALSSLVEMRFLAEGFGDVRL